MRNTVRNRYRKRYENKKTSGRRLLAAGIAVAAATLAAIGGLLLILYATTRNQGESPAIATLMEPSAEPLPAGLDSGSRTPQTDTPANTGSTDSVSDNQAEAAGFSFPEWRKDHTRVKGIYVSGPMAGSGGMEELIRLVDETELNTMVIDVKNDEGNITYQMDFPMAQDMNACIGYIRDMDTLMALLKEHGIYTIARIVCFKDPYLAESYPELALKKPDGAPVTDAYGLSWVNPYKEEVWDYLVQVGLKAAETGFDEIQYDYVRFPIGEDADAADYGVDMSTVPKKDAISGFLSYAAQRLHEKGIPVTADVFGTIIGSETDVRQVGQDYVELGSIVDVLCPMVYPSHYNSNVFGLPVPDAQPYEAVYHALQDSAGALEIVDEASRSVVRPWLQAFTASWVNGHISYGEEQIRRQIQAVYDNGYEEWILWNASNRYSSFFPSPSGSPAP